MVCVCVYIYRDVPWYRRGKFLLGNVWDLTLSVRNSLTETLRVFSSVHLAKSSVRKFPGFVVCSYTFVCVQSVCVCVNVSVVET